MQKKKKANSGGKTTKGIGIGYVKIQKCRRTGYEKKISKSYKDKERKTLFIVYFYWRISNNCSIMQNIYILKDESREVRNEDCVSGFDSGF